MTMVKNSRAASIPTNTHGTIVSTLIGSPVIKINDTTGELHDVQNTLDYANVDTLSRNYNTLLAMYNNILILTTVVSYV